MIERTELERIRSNPQARERAVADGDVGAFRIAGGSAIRRDAVLRFTWNGRGLTGRPGDTLASALLAHGERIVARSFKFHRPRGVFSAGIEEPNALVTVGAGGSHEPSTRATVLPLRDGLTARAQNCWPHVQFDVARVLDWCAPLWPAGFYNKTFLWPSWRMYEGLVRRAAGLGEAPPSPDPDVYETANAHCDLLVVGGGPAGLAAALTAAHAGAEVVLVEQDFVFGGALLVEDCRVADIPALEWRDHALRELRARPNVRVMAATTAFGLYDHGLVGLHERVADVDPSASVRHRYWRVRARSLVLATGSIEQPWICENNDVPGVMLAGAVRTYARRFGVAAGRNVVVATSDDSGVEAALDLVAAGVHVSALIDTRSSSVVGRHERLRQAGLVVHAEACATRVHGRRAVQGVDIGALDGSGRSCTLECDVLATCAGWAPAVHLWSHARGQLAFDAHRQCFLPASGTAPLSVAGALTGARDVETALQTGHAAAAAELARLGLRSDHWSPPPVSAARDASAHAPTDSRRSAPGGRRHRQWVDLQHDVTLADIDLAVHEGFDAIEHLKRYTTTGMSVDQGKTSNLNALLTVAALTGRDPAQVGATTYRPPYAPVTLGALAGRQIGEFYAPRRRLPAHAEHERLGACFDEAAGWMRPAWYARAGEAMTAAVAREVRTVRERVGLFDASPLGKIELEGEDAGAFLDFMYLNNVRTLGIGRLRYGLLLNESGVIIDDGTIARLDARRYVVTTTSGGAARIAAWFEEQRQRCWSDADVVVTPVTSQWATIAVAGPRARELLQQIPGDIDLSAQAFPHLHVRTGVLLGSPARVYRVSFSGELAFEVNVPASCGAALWRALEHAGRALDVAPYGLEALLLLRLEKGFLHVGLDTDGTTSPADVGWGEAAMKKRADFLGKRSLMRAENLRTDRLQLVGLESANGRAFVAGAHLRLVGTREGSDGWITSAARSPTLGRWIALALLRGGRARIDEHVEVLDLGTTGRARVAPIPFYDPQGERLNASDEPRTPSAWMGAAKLESEPASPAGVVYQSRSIEIEVAAAQSYVRLQLARTDAQHAAGIRVGETSLPLRPGECVGEAPVMLSEGPRSWLLVDAREDCDSLLAAGRRALGKASGAVVDLSDSLVRLTVRGPAALELLARATGLDARCMLSDARRCARTRFAQSPATVWLRAPDQFDVIVDRAPLQWLLSWMMDAASRL